MVESHQEGSAINVLPPVSFRIGRHVGTTDWSFVVWSVGCQATRVFSNTNNRLCPWLLIMAKWRLLSWSGLWASPLKINFLQMCKKFHHAFLLQECLKKKMLKLFTSACGQNMGLHFPSYSTNTLAKLRSAQLVSSRKNHFPCNTMKSNFEVDFLLNRDNFHPIPSLRYSQQY